MFHFYITWKWFENAENGNIWFSEVFRGHRNDTSGQIGLMMPKDQINTVGSLGVAGFEFQGLPKKMKFQMMKYWKIKISQLSDVTGICIVQNYWHESFQKSQ